MTDKDLQRAIDAFAVAHKIEDPLQLEEYLSKLAVESPWLREEVGSLLEAETPLVEGESAVGDVDAGSLFAPSFPTIPNCQITEELGSGGFGTVYRALRGPEELVPVAIKVLRWSRRSEAILARFQRERELHAQMDNQYVARLIDVGTSGEGDPYLMVELVEGGQTLLDYAENEKLAILERVSLFKKLCEGIEHLHLNGIYHRDLKPSNVLVSVVDGQAFPKVIDFGLAKADDKEELTQEGARIGTRGYMSPEQEAGERLDLRTDVYSLGVLLYELLTGVRPPLARTSSEQVPLPSSRAGSSEQLGDVLAGRRMRHVRQLTKSLRGDLDMIILKAIQFDRKDRYQSAHEFRSDLTRYEDHEPVLARGKSGIYTLLRLASRHRVASAAVCLGIFALAAGIAIASLSLAKERKASAGLSLALISERQATESLMLSKLETEAALLKEEKTSSELALTNESMKLMASFEADRIEAVDPAVTGPFLRKEILRQLEAKVPTEEFELLRARLENADFTAVAVESLRHGELEGAFSAIELSFGDRPNIQASLFASLARRLQAVGLLKESETPLRRTIALREETLGAAANETLLARKELGVLFRRLGKYAESSRVLDSVIRLRRETSGELDEDLLLARLARANVAAAEGDGARALADQQELLPLFMEGFGPDQEHTATLEGNIGGILVLEGEYSRAVDMLSGAHTKLSALLGPINVKTLRVLFSLSQALRSDGQVEAAASAGREAYEGLVAVKGISHPDTLSAATGLAQGLKDMGHMEEAKDLMLSTAEAMGTLYGEGDIRSVLEMANVNMMRRIVGEVEEARVSGALVIERARQCLAPGNPLLGQLLLDYALTLYSAGPDAYEESEAALLESYSILKLAFGESHAGPGSAANMLSSFYAEQHRLDPEGGHDLKRAEWYERANGHELIQTKESVEAVRKARREDGRSER